MPDPNQRPFTPEERRVLADVLRDIGRPGEWGLGLLASLALTLLIGVPVVAAGTTFLRWSRGVIPLVLLAVFAVVMTAWALMMRRRPDGGSAIKADLDAGVADVERHEATDALRVVMEEHRERGYFMKLKDGRVLFVGFWSPSPDDNPAKITHLPPDLPAYPCERFEIVRAPRSRILVAVRFLGATLPGVKTLEHAGDPETDPQSGEIVATAWEDLPKRTGSSSAGT